MQYFGLFCAVIVFLVMAGALLQARNVINALTKENEQLEREATDYADAYHEAAHKLDLANKQLNYIATKHDNQRTH